MKIFHLFTKILDFITKYLKVFIFLLVVGLIFAPKDDLPKQDANVARINLYGTILQSDTFLEELEKGIHLEKETKEELQSQKKELLQKENITKKCKNRNDCFFQFHLKMI